MSNQFYQTSGPGTNSAAPLPVNAGRDPINDFDLYTPEGSPYIVGQYWKNTTSEDAWQYLGNGQWTLVVPMTGAIETITGNTGGAVGGDASDNINLLGSGLVSISGNAGTSTLTVTTGSGGYPISPFVVGPVGQAGYQTIQSAIDAAVAAGGVSRTVYVQPGTYTENLNFSATTALTNGLTLVGAVGLGDEGQCEIIGSHTPPSSGALVVRNFKLSHATSLFSSVAAGTAHLSFIDMYFNVTNGFAFNLPNWTGIIELFDINGGTLNDGGLNNTGGATLLIFEAGFGSGSGQTMVTSGPVISNASFIACPVNFQTGSSVQFDNCIFGNPITLSNNSTGSFNECRFVGGASAAITMSSTAAVTVVQSIISSSANPVIAGAGAGTLSLGDLVFTSASNIAGTLTTSWLTSKLGPTTLSTPLTVPNGGTGSSSFTAYGPLVAAASSTGALTSVAPSATSGVPFVSQGAAANPAFGTAVVAGGGTGSTSFNINGAVISNTSGTGALSALTLTNGQVVIGSTGNPPAAATLTAGTNVSITNGANSITIASGTSSQVVAYTAVASSPYVVLSTDYYLGIDTTSARTIQLPNAPTTGRIFVVKDSTGSGATNNISITTVGGAVNIDGATTYTINNNYGATSLLFNGTSYEVY